MDALITEVHQRFALGGLRALGRTGLEILAVAPRRTGAGLWSRYATARAIAPSSRERPLAFAREVGRLAAAHGGLVTYPGTEEAITAFFENPSALGSEAILPYSGPEAVERVRDKHRLPAVAAAAGLRTPATLYEGPASGAAAATPPFPCVLKPYLSGGALESSIFVSDRADLKRLLAPLPPDEPVLLQEHLRGEVLSLEVVIDRQGRLVRRFQQRALRLLQPIGSIVRAVSVAPDEELMSKAARMLASAGYWGLACMQFLWDGRGPALIDVNPRFYGPMPLSLACGVNLPAAWHAVVIGEDPGPCPVYPTGVSYHRAEGDLGALLRGDASLVLERGPRPRVGGFWATDDPVPASFLTADALAKRLGRRLGPGRERTGKASRHRPSQGA